MFCTHAKRMVELLKELSKDHHYITLGIGLGTYLLTKFSVSESSILEGFLSRVMAGSESWLDTMKTHLRNRRLKHMWAHANFTVWKGSGKIVVCVSKTINGHLHHIDPDPDCLKEDTRHARCVASNSMSQSFVPLYICDICNLRRFNSMELNTVSWLYAKGIPIPMSPYQEKCLSQRAM